MIEKNQESLVKAFEYQNAENFEQSIKCLEGIFNNFQILGLMADQFAYTPELIQDYREILSQAHLDSIYDKSSESNIDKYYYVKPKEKEKQVKNKWTEKEQQLFLEGLEKFGMKNIKSVTAYIGTRTVGQVRSHLQKHLIKEKKKELSKKEIDIDENKESGNVSVEQSKKGRKKKNKKNDS